VTGHAPFSIGEALDAYDAHRREEQVEREAERERHAPHDPLDDYAASLSATAHPPSECGDPYDCPAHGEQYRAYHDQEKP